MRYFEMIEKKAAHIDGTVAASASGKKTQLIRIPAGSGPVQVYVRDGKLFVISDHPLEKVTQQ